MLRRILTGIVRFYQRGVSPFTPAACRFTPSCSEYALQALERHGAARGGWLTLRRLLRCHPLGGKGFDPVPGAPGVASIPEGSTDRPNPTEAPRAP